MTLQNSTTDTIVRAIADITIDGRTTRMSTQWVKPWEIHGQYGAEERLKDAAKDLVKDYEQRWGPVKAAIVVKREERVTTTQTYQSQHITVTSTMKAGSL